MARATSKVEEPKTETTIETKATPVNTVHEKELTPSDYEYWEQKVDYIHPKDLSKTGDDSIVCSVNGDTIRIKPGHVVHIKRKFVDALQRSLEATYKRAEDEAKTLDF